MMAKHIVIKTERQTMHLLFTPVFASAIWQRRSFEPRPARKATPISESWHRSGAPIPEPAKRIVNRGDPGEMDLVRTGRIKIRRG
jgi:hypothetical protein